MNRMYLLEERVDNEVHTRKLFRTREELFVYLLENEDRVFNYGHERNQLVIIEVEVESRV